MSLDRLLNMMTLSNFFTFVILMCFTFKLSAQTEVASSKEVVKQKGMYKSFTEFIENSPSVPYQATLESREEIITLFIPPLIVYKLNFGDSLPCDKNTRIWGFCDGRNFYKARYSSFSKRNTYDKILFVGKYIYYQSTESSYGAPIMMASPAGGGGMMMGGGSSKRLMDFSIDPNTGYPKEITLELLREMIVDDKELIQEFERQKGKKKKIGSYFLKYLERQEKKNNP